MKDDQVEAAVWLLVLVGAPLAVIGMLGHSAGLTAGGLLLAGGGLAALLLAVTGDSS